VLREITKTLSKEEIVSDKIQQLIQDMKQTLKIKKYGIGLAAPQVGESLAISVIGIKPTPTRPKLKMLDMIVINPKVTKTYGVRKGMWEGCVSGPELYAKALRYSKIRLSYLDENADEHESDFSGLAAQVLQHEVDHLNGILFVDRVKDTKSYTTFSEYKKRRKSGHIK
jgi:peptide deformylase